VAQELATAGNIKSKQLRKDVTAALTGLQERLRLLPATLPPNGLACFAGWSYV
jgi:peptide subunit release factor 1 (eRF1)